MVRVHGDGGGAQMRLARGWAGLDASRSNPESSSSNCSGWRLLRGPKRVVVWRLFVQITNVSSSMFQGVRLSRFGHSLHFVGAFHSGPLRDATMIDMFAWEIHMVSD